MESAGNDLQRRSLGSGEWSTRSKLRAHTRGLPRIILSIGPDETSSLLESPSFSVLVDLVNIVVRREIRAVREAIDGREEQTALPLPVCGIDETGDDCYLVARRSVLPVAKWLVAQHPLPLQIDVVVNSSVGEENIGRVVGVHALGLTLIFVAVSLAETWDESLVHPVGIGWKGLSKSNAVLIWSNCCAGFDVLFAVSIWNYVFFVKDLPRWHRKIGRSRSSWSRSCLIATAMDHTREHPSHRRSGQVTPDRIVP